MVDVVNPSEPRMHVGNRDREASVYDESHHDNRSRSHGLGDCSGGCSNSTEYHRHCKGAHKREEQENEEIFRCTSQKS